MLMYLSIYEDSPSPSPSMDLETVGWRLVVSEEQCDGPNSIPQQLPSVRVQHSRSQSETSVDNLRRGIYSFMWLLSKVQVQESQQYPLSQSQHMGQYHYHLCCLQAIVSQLPAMQSSCRWLCNERHNMLVVIHTRWCSGHCFSNHNKMKHPEFETCGWL